MFRKGKDELFSSGKQVEKYTQGIQILEAMVGTGKDNVVALATISKQLSPQGLVRPNVRDVDAMYEAGAFYIVSDARSHKVLEVDAHQEVSVSTNFEDFHSYGVARNLGWVLNPENALLRDKLKKVFEAWYEPTNNEQDPNTVYIEVKLTQGCLRLNHGKEFYHFDFEKQTAKHELFE